MASAGRFLAATVEVAAELCRSSAVNGWVASQSDLQQSLQQIIEGDAPLFDVAASSCAGEVESYNSAAATTCYLQSRLPDSASFNADDTDASISYHEFWEVGASDLDGLYTLAWDFYATSNFTATPPLNECSNDCYVSDGGVPGCVNGASWITAIGRLSQRYVCDMEWYAIDNAWNNLRVCVATALAGQRKGANVTREKEMMAAFQDQQLTTADCAKVACEAILMTEAGDTGDESTLTSTSTAARAQLHAIHWTMVGLLYGALLWRNGAASMCT